MPAVKFDDSNVTTWHIASNRKPRLKIPLKKNGVLPALDYERLKALCDINGLATGSDGHSTPEAHAQFMHQCRSIFIEPIRQRRASVHRDSFGILSLIPSYESFDTDELDTGRPTEVHKRHSFLSSSPSNMDHDIRTYTKLLHHVRSDTELHKFETNRYKQLRKLLRKFPFERKPEDNEALFNILKTLKFLQDEVPMDVLKDLCMFVSLVVVKESVFTVFGNQGLHLVLKGSVRPQTDPNLRTKTTPMAFRVPTPILEDSPTRITVGQFFGTLSKVEGRESNSKILSVITCEENCEFLKISTSDYARVIEQIQQRKEQEKINVFLSCENYKLWPRQPLLKVSSLLEWISYPPNTVLVSEGYTAPYIGIVKSGECHVLKQLKVVDTLKNRHKVKRTRQVVMGKLEQCQSFGEISVLCKEPITCTIVSATAVELGIIKPYKVDSLDETTIQLFKQSNTQTYGHLSKDQIETEYITQERKREWNEYKHTMVMNVINSRGIRPGYGKWAL